MAETGAPQATQRTGFWGWVRNNPMTALAVGVAAVATVVAVGAAVIVASPVIAAGLGISAVGAAAVGATATTVAINSAVFAGTLQVMPHVMNAIDQNTEPGVTRFGLKALATAASMLTGAGIVRGISAGLGALTTRAATALGIETGAVQAGVRGAPVAGAAEPTLAEAVQAGTNFVGRVWDRIQGAAGYVRDTASGVVQATRERIASLGSQEGRRQLGRETVRGAVLNPASTLNTGTNAASYSSYVAEMVGRLPITDAVQLAAGLLGQARNGLGFIRPAAADEQIRPPRDQSRPLPRETLGGPR